MHSNKLVQTCIAYIIFNFFFLNSISKIIFKNLSFIYLIWENSFNINYRLYYENLNLYMKKKRMLVAIPRDFTLLKTSLQYSP